MGKIIGLIVNTAETVETVETETVETEIKAEEQEVESAPKSNTRKKSEK